MKKLWTRIVMLGLCLAAVLWARSRLDDWRRETAGAAALSTSPDHGPSTGDGQGTIEVSMPAASGQDGDVRR